MQTIFKYSIALETPGVSIVMPSRSTILCLQMQHGVPCIWARVETDSPPCERHFLVAGTGHILPERFGRYVGTFQTASAEVFHVFELREPYQEQDLPRVSPQ